LESQPRVTLAALAGGAQGPEIRAKGNNRIKNNRLQKLEGRRPGPVLRLWITDFKPNN
jgi:hypothetical protein